MFPETLSNSTSASLICLYPLSGQYELLQRILYWVIVAFTIFWHSHRWLVGGAFASVMLYSSTAVIHAIVLYGARSKAYYDADAVAICEIIICSAILIPAYLTHSRNLDSTAKRILLQIWGSLLFLGGLFAILPHVVKRANPTGYPCQDWSNTTWTMLDISSWSTGSNCSIPVVPCANATHLMRPLDDIKILKSAHSLAQWTEVIANFSNMARHYVNSTNCGINVDAFRDRSAEKTFTAADCQIEAHKRAKGNHPADTPQLPVAIMGGIAFAGCCEKTLSLIPRSESPSALGQWAAWVQLGMVLISVLILRLVTPVETEANIPSLKKAYVKETRSKITQTDA